MASKGWLRGTKTVLTADAQDTAHRLAVAEFRFINRHRLSAYALTLSIAAGVFVFLWRAVNLTVAIFLVGLCLVYGIALAVVAAIRLRRIRQRP